MTMVSGITNLSLVQNEDRLGKVWINMIAAWVAQGWTVQGSGDGIAAYENSGQTAGPYNVFTSGTGYVTTGGVWASALGGANKISNTRAWVRMREPSPSVREIVIQRTSTASNGFENYAIIGIAYAGYLVANAAANSPPTTAGTSQFILGSAFNATGVDCFGAHVITSVNTLIANMIISDTVAAEDVWPFYLVVYNSTGALRAMGWIYESLVDTVPGDPDPLVTVCSPTFTSVYGTPNAAPAVAFIGRRDDGTVLTNLQVMSYTIPTFGGLPAVTPAINPLDSKLRSMPCYVASGVALDGRYKGRLEHFTMNMQARNYPSTLDIASVDAKIYLGCFLADWEQSLTPGT